MDSLIACTFCGQVQWAERLKPGETACCVRCDSDLGRPKPHSRARTAAFSLAALILYVPANVYPILKMDLYGAYSESTVWDGCVRLFHSGTWPVAIIVFCASILVPFLKMAGLFFLVATARSGRRQRLRTAIYKIIEVAGPWAMLDVFLLSVLVALVKLEKIATILPGPGILAFAGVVVLTILASSAFDPRLIWDRDEEAV